jgi:hypothetical protein
MVCYLTSWSRVPREEPSNYAVQIYPHYLWNSQVHCRDNNSPQLNIVLSHTVSIHIAKMQFILFHLLLALPGGLFLSDSPFIFCMIISPAYVVLLDFVALITFDE